MNSPFDYSPFKPSKKEKSFVSSSLKKLSVSPLFQISKKDLKLAKTIWKTIKKSHSTVFIFAFGGMGSSAKIANSLSPTKNKNVFLIDAIDEKFLSCLSSLKKTKLQSSHSIFISKSGQTKEILFYKSFLQKIYFNKQLSLKGKVTVLTQALRSPLLKWAKKEGCSVMLSDKPFPGRFSFFTLSGLLQFQAYGFDWSDKMFNNPPKALKTLEFQQTSTGLFANNPPATAKALEFFIHQSVKRKEIFFCPFDLQLKELSHWLELSWSESLFKKETERQAPVLRNIALSDLRHACIEELIAKKDQVCFWALDIKSKNKPDSLYKKQIKKLLKTKKIPYMFMQLSLNSQKSLAGLIIDFYKILSCLGDFSKSDIYTQPWVDYLKRA